MKKVFMLLMVVGAFTIFPCTSKAMIELDENGNPITRNVKEGEVTILSIPEDSGTASTTSDMPVSNNDVVDNANDVVKTTGTENPELYTTTEANDKDNNDLLNITLSTVAGLSIGSVGTYLFLTKRK